MKKFSILISLLLILFVVEISDQIDGLVDELPGITTSSLENQ